MVKITVNKEKKRQRCEKITSVTSSAALTHLVQLGVSKKSQNVIHSTKFSAWHLKDPLSLCRTINIDATQSPRII